MELYVAIPLAVVLGILCVLAIVARDEVFARSNSERVPSEAGGGPETPPAAGASAS